MSRAGQADANRRLHVQYETTRALAESASLAEAAPRILKALGETLGFDHGAVWTVDRSGTSIRCLDTWHPPSVAVPEFDAVSRATTFERAVGLPGRVWRSGEPAWIEDVVRDSNFPRAAVAAREGLHGAFGFPIKLGGIVLGVLEFFSREIREPDQDLLELLATIGSQIGQFVERKRAENELEALFNMSRDLLCIAGFDGYFRRLNPAWEETLGYSIEELMSRPYVDFVHPDDRKATNSEAQSVSTGQSALRFENRYRRRDGSYRWLSWNSAPILEQGLVYCVARDVTEQKAAARGAARGARGRRGGEPRQERLPRERQPRDPHADERGDRHGRAAARHAAARRAARVRERAQGVGRVAARPDRRPARLRAHRGRQARAGRDAVRSARAGGRHAAHARGARAPEGPRARLAHRARRAAGSWRATPRASGR